MQKQPQEIEFNIPTVCKEHSGLIVWVKVGCGLLTMLCGLFSYSSFIQFPAYREEVLKQTSRLEQKLAYLENTIKGVQETQTRIIAQRNLDHKDKDTFR